MAWDPIDNSELTPGFPILKHVRQAWNCLQWLYGQIGTLALSYVLNGSFEIDSDGNGQPDNWTLSTYPGGSGAVVTDVPAHGTKAVRLVHPGGSGNGGGYYESDYVICSELQRLFLGFIHWSSAAGMHNKVTVRFFDKAKVYISATTLYDSTANPTSPTYFISAFLPPAGARFYKVDLIGGYSDINVAGSAYFDGVGPVGLEMFAARSSSATIAEVSVYSNPSVLSDVANMTFVIPYLGLPLVVSFNADAHGVVGGGGTIYMRFRTGSYYSATFDTDSTAYVTSAFTLSLPAGVATGSLKVYMQLQSNTIDTQAFGRKLDAAIGLAASLG